MERNINDLTAEINGCSALVHLLFNIAESWDEISKPSNDIFQNAFFTIEWHLDRIAEDMNRLDSEKEV